MKFVPEINLPYDDFFIFHSCNGLLCFARTFRDTFHDDIYLCNPILGEYVSVPLAGSQETRQKSYFALGLCAIAQEYKVLRTFYLKTGDNVQPEAEIYTLGTGQWSSIQKALRGPHECMFDSFVCGSFQWVLSNQQNRVNGIGSFNFESEQFSQLSLPPRYHHRHVGVTVFKGCLGVSFYETCEQFEIWVMKQYGIKESWTKQFTITNQALYCRNLYDPLIFLNNGLILMLGDDKRVVFYDTRRKFMNVIRISQTRGDIYVTAYKPSFVSLKEVAKGEQVKMSRTQASGKDDKSSAEGTSNCTSHDQLSRSVSPE